MTRAPGVRRISGSSPPIERERPDHHRREARLDAVRADGPLAEDRAGVVDEDVQARLGGEHLLRGGSHGRERSHVRHDHREAIGAVARDERVPHGGQSLPIATHQHDACSDAPPARRPPGVRGRTSVR